MRFLPTTVAMCCTLSAGVARADDSAAAAPSPPHTFSAGFGFGPRFVHLTHTYSERLGMGGGSFGALVAYGYRISRAFEVGAGGGYWNGPELNAFMARLSVRPTFSIDDNKEVSVAVSGGLLIWPHAEPNATRNGTRTVVWTGPSVSVGVDFTYWMTRGFGPRGFIEAAWGRANGENIKPDTTFFLAATAGIGCVGRL